MNPALLSDDDFLEAVRVALFFQRFGRDRPSKRVGSSVMRFWIEQQTKWGFCRLNSPYRVHLPNTVLIVRRPVFHARLDWTWQDGTEYSLTFPNLASAWGERSWHIISKERTICSGQLVNYSLLEVIGRAKLPHQEWDFHGNVIVPESKKRLTKQLRQRDGRRLALWRSRRCGFGGEVWRGVWRNSLPESDVPIILGMVLAQVHTEYDPVG
jgi:hypothetical protein